jgi:hypothetical protein
MLEIFGLWLRILNLEIKLRTLNVMQFFLDRHWEKHMRQDPHCTCNNCMEVYDAETIVDDSQLNLFQ